MNFAVWELELVCGMQMESSFQFHIYVELLPGLLNRCVYVTEEAFRESFYLVDLSLVRPCCHACGFKDLLPSDD